MNDLGDLNTRSAFECWAYDNCRSAGAVEEHRGFDEDYDIGAPVGPDEDWPSGGYQCDRGQFA